MPHDAQFRRATTDDATDVADVWLASFQAALPTVRRAHTDDEVRAWLAHVVIPQQETWIARDGDACVGMMVLQDGWLQQLYLSPAHRGRGIGDRFVALAKERSPAGLQLWTFQVNAPARRFYERHGFTEVERTDGATNEEREPDVRYAWQPD